MHSVLPTGERAVCSTPILALRGCFAPLACFFDLLGGRFRDRAGREARLLGMFRCAPLEAHALALYASIATVALVPPHATASEGSSSEVRAHASPGANGSHVTPVGLEYAAASECPDEAAFLAAVRARGGELQRPPPELSGATIAVSLQHADAAFTGSVMVRASGASVRHVRAADCEQAMQAVALITAAALHESTAPVADALNAPTPAATPVAASTRLERVGQFGADGVQVGPGTLVFDNQMAFSLGVGIELSAVPGPALPRYELSFTRANYVTTPDGNHYLGGGWLPRLRLALIGTGEYESHGERARVDLVETSFGGCTALSYDLEGLVMLACGELGVGLGNVDVHDASGAAAPAQSVAFGLAGLDLETRYALGPFHIGLKLGATAASRWTAERADGSELFRSSPFSGHALIDVGVHY